MNRTAGIVVLVIVMIAIIVAIDVLFMRDRFSLRLVVNLGIVALVTGCPLISVVSGRADF